MRQDTDKNSQGLGVDAWNVKINYPGKFLDDQKRLLGYEQIMAQIVSGLMLQGYDKFSPEEWAEQAYCVLLAIKQRLRKGASHGEI